MPAWDAGGSFGVKLVSVAPSNASSGIPTINGLYVLFSADSGVPLALFDAGALTARRTAAASALASRCLARPDSRCLLMVGTGRVARQLIAAHCSVRPIDDIRIWGRTKQRARDLAADVASKTGIQCAAVADIASNAPDADIISTATFAESPLLEGRWVSAGTHVDLVGAFKPTMCEADIDLVAKADRVFVDTVEGATTEAGDLIQAADHGDFSFDDIAGDMYTLASDDGLRQDADEVTVFKSVGTALQDLAAAQLCVRADTGDKSGSLR